MKAELAAIKERLLAEVQSHKNAGDISALAQLAPKLKELELLERNLTNLTMRISDFGQSRTATENRDSTVKPNRAQTPSVIAPQQHQRVQFKREQTRLRITVRWSLLGKKLPDEMIEERFANRTQAKLLARLGAELGPQTLQQLKQFSKSQGGRMHVAEHPASDPNFTNQATGRLYANIPIPGTALNLLTNTSTPEKKSDIENFISFMRLRPDAFSIEITEK